GRISGDGTRLLRPFRHQDRRRRARARGAGMVDHARLAFGPRGLAVHAGTGGTAGRAAFGEVGLVTRDVTALGARRPPRRRGTPVRRGFRAQLQLLWNTGSPAFAGDDSGACGSSASGCYTLTPRSGIEA